MPAYKKPLVDPEEDGEIAMVDPELAKALDKMPGPDFIKAGEAGLDLVQRRHLNQWRW